MLTDLRYFNRFNTNERLCLQENEAYSEEQGTGKPQVSLVGKRRNRKGDKDYGNPFFPPVLTLSGLSSDS